MQNAERLPPSFASQNPPPWGREARIQNLRKLQGRGGSANEFHSARGRKASPFYESEKFKLYSALRQSDIIVCDNSDIET